MIELCIIRKVPINPLILRIKIQFRNSACSSARNFGNKTCFILCLIFNRSRFWIKINLRLFLKQVHQVCRILLYHLRFVFYLLRRHFCLPHLNLHFVDLDFLYPIVKKMFTKFIFPFKSSDFSVCIFLNL